MKLLICNLLRIHNYRYIKIRRKPAISGQDGGVLVEKAEVVFECSLCGKERVEKMLGKGEIPA